MIPKDILELMQSKQVSTDLLDSYKSSTVDSEGGLSSTQVFGPAVEAVIGGVFVGNFLNKQYTITVYAERGGQPFTEKKTLEPYSAWWISSIDTGTIVHLLAGDDKTATFSPLDAWGAWIHYYKQSR